MFKQFLLCALALLPASAFAATTPNSVILPQTPKMAIVQFLQGTDVAGTYKTIYTGGSNGSVCTALYMNNNDGSATHLVTVQYKSGSVYYGGTAVTTVSSAGFANGTQPQNLMSSAQWPGLPVNSDGNPFIYLNSGDTLTATFATSLTSTTAINIHAICGDY